MASKVVVASTPGPIVPGVVAVIGACGHLGGHLVARLVREEGIDAVVAIDSTTPSTELRRRMRGAQFVRIDPQNPLVSKVFVQEHVRTVVHVGVSPYLRGGGRAALKERNVLGSMQVIAACRNVDSVRRVVLRSSASVYGSSARDPAVFTESRPTTARPGGVAQDFLDVEGYLRGLRRHRKDVETTVLRMAEVVGGWSESPLVAGLRLPVVPTVLGYDPRIQLLHEEDALDVLVHATLCGRDGTFNVAGEGAVALSAIIGRVGHVPMPIPGFLYPSVVRPLLGGYSISPANMDFLRYGRVIDTTRLREKLGFRPRHSTSDTVRHLLASGLGEPLITRARADAVGGAVVSVVRAVTGKRG